MGSPRAIGYLRVSTTEQELGLEAQAAALETAAARLGVPLAESHTDTGLSGGLPLEQRPALLAALDALQPGDCLLVAKRDRLGRDVMHVAMIERLCERKGARIISAAGEGTENNEPTSMLMRTIIDAFAQYERAIIRSRTRAAMAALKARGQRVGGIPWGWRVGDDGLTLVPDLEERELLTEMWALRHQGLALISIAEVLNERGLRNRQGRLWQPNFIGQLLERHPQSENGNHS